MYRSTDLYYEQIQQHHYENGPSAVGEPSNGQPAPGVKKPHTPYTIEEILKPTAPRPRPPSPCGLLVDGVCTCGLTGSVVSTAFYVDVQQQFMCSQQHRYWNYYLHWSLYYYYLFIYYLCIREKKKNVCTYIYSIYLRMIRKQYNIMF